MYFLSNQELTLIQKGQKPSSYYLEIIAVMERALCFAHTGNVRVLSRTIMDPLWVSMGIVYDGAPCIAPILQTSGSSRPPSFSIEARQWPIHKSESRHLMASQASIKYHFGQAQSNVCHSSVYPFF